MRKVELERFLRIFVEISFISFQKCAFSNKKKSDRYFSTVATFRLQTFFSIESSNVKNIEKCQGKIFLLRFLLVFLYFSQIFLWVVISKREIFFQPELAIVQGLFENEIGLFFGFFSASLVFDWFDFDLINIKLTNILSRDVNGKTGKITILLKVATLHLFIHHDKRRKLFTKNGKNNWVENFAFLVARIEKSWREIVSWKFVLHFICHSSSWERQKVYAKIEQNGAKKCSHLLLFHGYWYVKVNTWKVLFTSEKFPSGGKLCMMENHHF